MLRLAIILLWAALFFGRNVMVRDHQVDGKTSWLAMRGGGEFVARRNTKAPAISISVVANWLLYPRQSVRFHLADGVLAEEARLSHATSNSADPFHHRRDCHPHRAPARDLAGHPAARPAKSPVLIGFWCCHEGNNVRPSPRCWWRIRCRGFAGAIALRNS